MHKSTVLLVKMTAIHTLAGSCSRVYDSSFIANLENFAVEVALAISTVEEAKGLIFAKNSIFGVYGEVDKLKRISLDAARKHPTRSLTVHEQTIELVGSLNDQLFQLRKATDLLKSTIKDSSSSAVVEHLQRITVCKIAKCDMQTIVWKLRIMYFTATSEPSEP